jgi:iron(II)-dependent oxidoreductase
MLACRASTLRLAQDLAAVNEFRRQAHPDFSPIGWHLGHIAFTESLWLLERLQRSPCPYPQYQKLFAADGLPKAERENLPDLPTILAYMADIRDRTLTCLEHVPLGHQLRLWRWLLQHESQHVETATYLLTLHRWPQTSGSGACRGVSVFPTARLGRGLDDRHGVCARRASSLWAWRQH